MLQSIKIYLLLLLGLCLTNSAFAQPGDTGESDATQFSTERCVVRNGENFSVDKIQSTIINQRGGVDIAYFNLKGAPFDVFPTDTILGGYCPAIQIEKYVDRRTITEAETIELVQGSYLSYSIANEGFAPIQLLIDGQPSTLVMGSVMGCEMEWDEAQKKMVYCPTIKIIIPEEGGRVNYFHRVK